MDAARWCRSAPQSSGRPLPTSRSKSDTSLNSIEEGDEDACVVRSSSISLVAQPHFIAPLTPQRPDQSVQVRAKVSPEPDTQEQRQFSVQQQQMCAFAEKLMHDGIPLTKPRKLLRAPYWLSVDGNLLSWTLPRRRNRSSRSRNCIALPEVAAVARDGCAVLLQRSTTSGRITLQLQSQLEATLLACILSSFIANYDNRSSRNGSSSTCTCAKDKDNIISRGICGTS
jgi:hypothetical protein